MRRRRATAGGGKAGAAARRARLRKDVLARAERRPAVYRMLGPEGEVLYVGKSVRLRSRLLSYLRAAPGAKSADLIRGTRSIRWNYVPNEFWALVRELRLIKRWRPPYNVEHARKTRYAFVKLTTGPAARIVPVSRVTGDGAACFGPFPRPGRLGDTLRELSRVLGLRDCAAETPIHFGDQLELFGGGRPPRCLRAETGSCLAPCAGRCTEEEYRKRVRIARRFLEGRTRRPIELVEEEMREAARRMDFEYASILRDRAERLSRLQERLVAFRGRVEALSFLYRVPGFRGDDRLYLVRRGLVLDHVPYPKGKEERLRAAARIEEVFGRADRDPGRLTPAEAAEILLVADWFRRNPAERSRTRAPDEWLEERTERVRRAGG